MIFLYIYIYLFECNGYVSDPEMFILAFFYLFSEYAFNKNPQMNK